MASSINLLFLYLTAAGASCLTALLLLYNVVAGVLFLREPDRADASGSARAAWALGLAALLGWPFTCVGTLLGLAAVAVAWVERRRIYQDRSSIAGATPTRMGRLNGMASLLFQLTLALSVLVGAMVGTDPGAAVEATPGLPP